ncbi:biopolymer transporter Tol [Microbacteriaceae bacterium VKM Ac-2855]|nr:biopolymer transporter Tol [Microbacteriaceae bacterium VKM Ac-2855]
MPRILAPGQTAQLFVFDVASGTSSLVFASETMLFEAPNWSPDGSALVVNADGGLFRIPLEAPELQPIALDGVPAELNNDHVLAPDGLAAYVSARDGHLYSVALDGSRPAERLTTPRGERFKHYLHGVSPEGATLALIGGGPDASGDWVTNVYTMPASGGPLTQLTDDSAPDDGVEFDATAEWLLFNSERETPGTAQLFRMPADGSAAPSRLHASATVDWFPHASPDGRWVQYLAYEAGTAGHPADLPVALRMLDTSDGSTRELVTLFGGQGTTNVNGWAPDSTRFAYVAYPLHLDLSSEVGRV